ncbi:YopX family protein [Pyramidobacter piscolens]|uniref:YopX family protein n=1 Tax=Pyramidobacter piscolens TaxID=638849 RepID=UPI002AAFC2ED|nr:YopX family protein [Pyramidobacter piscolens]
MTMRKIKFRGMSKSGKWLYGHFYVDEIDEKTINQYTGLKDRDGREIYEGDILDFERMPGKNAHGYVAYCDDKARYVVRFQREKYERALSWVCAVGNPVIIGNTYENPELLEAEVNNA